MIMVCSIEHYLYRCCQISSEMLIHKIITVRHKTDRSNQHCTQSCSIPSHLGWWSNVAIKLDWFSRPRASVQHASASLCARPVRLCVRLHMRVFVPILSAWVTRMRNRARSKVVFFLYKTFAQFRLCSPRPSTVYSSWRVIYVFLPKSSSWKWLPTSGLKFKFHFSI